MADSIHATVPDAEAEDAEQRREARREVTREIQERGLAAAQASALADAPLRMSGPELACAHIVCQSAVFLAGVWTRRRPLRDEEKTVLRILGGLAFRAGLQQDALVLALETAVEEMLEVVRPACRTLPWTGHVVRSVIAGLEADARTFADAALAELEIGHRVERMSAADVTDTLRAILDDQLRDGDAAHAATAGIDTGTAYGVVLLTGAHRDSPRCEAAAASILERVPYAIDLGRGGPVAHRRLLVPHLSPAQWLDARIDIDAIARRHSLLAVAPAPCDLTTIARVYWPLAAGLDTLVERSGMTAGIVDPACVEGATDTAAALRPPTALAATAA